MPTHPRLTQAAIRHQVYLERLKTGQVRQFLAVFAESDKAIKAVLRESGVDVLSELSGPELEDLLTTLTQQQGELFTAAIDEWIQQLPELAVYEAQHEVRALKSEADAKTKRKLKIPSAKKLAKESLSRPIQAFGARVEDVAENWTRSAIQRTNAAIRIGYAQGRTVPQIVKDLIGTGELNYKDGKGAISRRAAATMVRTGVQQVASTARQVTYEENADVVVGYEWVSTLDSKTTIQCQALDGQKFKTGEGPLPPIHPNCRSTTTPDLGPEFDFLDEGSTRSSQDGYVDAQQTYYEWLKGQSAEFQDGVLGATRGKLFREGGLSAERFAELQLDRNFEPITLEEMRKLEPKAFNRAGI